MTSSHRPALLCLWLTACGPAAPSAPPAMPPVPVSVVAVVPQDIPVEFDYLGRTEGSREIEVRARVQGFIERRHFVEGAMVPAGELLFQIDDKPLRAQQVGARAEVGEAEARWQQTAREAARLQPLVADEAVTRKEYDDAVSAELTTKAALASAQARLLQIELDLQYTRVTAPFPGKVGRALRQEGSLVDAGDNGLLTTLLQLDPIYAAFQRSENQQYELERALQSGRLAMPASGQFTVELRHRDGTVLASGGVLDFADGRLDPTTGTIPLRATLPNPQLRLLAGQAVVVVLRGAALKDALAVPQRAVVESPRGKALLVAVDKDGATVFEQRPVEVGEWVTLPGEGPQTRGWVIRGGLHAGDRVIVDNLVRLGQLPPGMPVQIVPLAPADAARGNGAPTDAPAPGDGKKGN